MSAAGIAYYVDVQIRVMKKILELKMKKTPKAYAFGVGRIWKPFSPP